MSYLGSMSWHYIKSLEVSKIQQLDNFHRKLTVKIGDDFFELDFFSEEKNNLEIREDK